MNAITPNFLNRPVIDRIVDFPFDVFRLLMTSANKLFRFEIDKWSAKCIN